MPEYLVDDGLIGDERDDVHGAAAPRTEQRVLLPDSPDEPGPTDTSAFEPLALVPASVIGRASRGFVAAAHHPALPGGVGVEAVVEKEALVWVGDLY